MFRFLFVFCSLMVFASVVRSGQRHSIPPPVESPALEAPISQNPQDVIWEPLQPTHEPPPWRRG